MIGHRVRLSALAYLSEYGELADESFHQEMYKQNL
jgi:hypothetical protein